LIKYWKNVTYPSWKTQRMNKVFTVTGDIRIEILTSLLWNG
jgi:hypothetical protein